MICRLCNRAMENGKYKPCGKYNMDGSCEHFDYRETVNKLCSKCLMDCKQYEHVTVLRCPKFKSSEILLEQKVD